MCCTGSGIGSKKNHLRLSDDTSLPNTDLVKQCFKVTLISPK